jgi:hypothetical protein
MFKNESLPYLNTFDGRLEASSPQRSYVTRLSSRWMQTVPNPAPSATPQRYLVISYYIPAQWLVQV